MKEMALSKFKIHCLAVVAEVEKTGEPVRLTRFGKAVAEINPMRELDRSAWFGCMAGEMEIHGDIVGPIGAIQFTERPKRRKK